ncbi:dienelactone hydrolase family protein [Sphingomonas flavalba]|uniref:dienelactone hydrolase family protein n=1 Tax=Sphingomonas flavalba TaxID=2559804 RepID=UPI00109DDAAC|nr:dienelactone hydrolase family protein [Sphingomonas flavalba]
MHPSELRARAIALYDHFTHEGRDRRRFMRELTLLAGSAAAAETLLAAIAANPAAAAIIAEGDARLKAGMVQWDSAPGRAMRAYVVDPAAGPGKAVVVVIHENRGLTPHIRDVARRVALAGYTAVAVDLLAPDGGTPADEDKGREMIGKLDIAAATRDAQSAFTRFAAERKAGVVGFCWGGAMVDRLAVAGAHNLAAAVSYYGPAPAPEEAAKVKVPLMLQLAGLDTRVAQTAHPFAEALKAAGKPVIVHDYPGVHHAFNNDSSAERYNADAAKLAWDRTIAFFDRLLKG